MLVVVVPDVVLSCRLVSVPLCTPPFVVWKAPAVMGKSVEVVEPTARICSLSVPETAGITVIVMVCVAEFKLAVTVTEVEAVTDADVKEKLTLLLPCGTVTLAGTVMLVLELLSVTTVPPTGAN